MKHQPRICGERFGCDANSMNFGTMRMRCLRVKTPQSEMLQPARSRTFMEGSCVNEVNSSRSEEHTSELQSRLHLVCRLLLEKKKKKIVLPTTLMARNTLLDPK